ncbi:MAG: hypothetical protein ABI183_00780 [Polyangiaceae bacterium]
MKNLTKNDRLASAQTVKVQSLAVPAAPISRAALDRSVQRTIRFLRAAQTSSRIMAQLAAGGFTIDQPKEGWQLVFIASGVVVSSQTGDNPVAGAITEISAVTGNYFKRTRAVLHHLHRDVEAFLFQDLTSGTGPAAVPALNTFLERCQALENSPERKATRKGDHAALASMEARGITAAERTRLQGLVDIVQSQIAQPASIGNEDARTLALTNLYEWITDWSETAQALVTSRADRISLGIAKRRSRKDDAAPVPTPQPSPVTITPIAAPPEPPVVNPPLLNAAPTVEGNPTKAA